MSDPESSQAASPSPKAAYQLSTPAKVMLCAFFIQAWLLLLHFRLAGHATANVRVVGQAFDLVRESSIPTAFAAFQAIIASIIAGVMATEARKDLGSRSRWLGWLGVTIIFFIIAVDDAAAIHERLNAVISLELLDRLHYPSYPWHVILGPFFVLALLLPMWVVRADIGATTPQQWALGGAFLCFALSQGFDFSEGWEVMTRTPGDPVSAQMIQMMVAEEVLEMIGTTLFIYVFLSTLLHTLPHLSLSAPQRLTPNTNQP